MSSFTQKYGFFLAIALVAGGVYCRANNGAVLAATKTAPTAIDAVVVLEQTMTRPALPADINSIPLEPAISFEPTAESIAQVERLEQDRQQDQKLAALEGMEPLELSEVYQRSIMRDNRHLNADSALAIGYAYAIAEKRYDLPNGLLFSIVNRESNHRAAAKSSEDAIGLMQVQVPTAFDAAKRLGKISAKAKPKDWPKYQKKLVVMLQNPKGNIELGANTLHHYLHLNHGSLTATLKQYSHGARDYNGRIISRMKKIQAEIAAK